MTFRDLLLDKIQETSLFEMAHKRANILDKCLFLCGQIQLHLVKIKFFYNKNDFNHHVKDINNWIKDIQRMTLDGKKRLDKKYYYEGLFSDPIDDGDSYKDYFKDLITKKQGYLHLYEKEPRLNRKIGHINFYGNVILGGNDE